MTNTSPLHGDAAYNRLLGEWLARPDVRIARALKSLEWSTAEALFQKLEVTSPQIAEYARALARLVKSGHIEHRAPPECYRLARELATPPRAPVAVPSTPGTDGEEREGWFFWRGTWRKV